MAAVALRLRVRISSGVTTRSGRLVIPKMPDGDPLRPTNLRVVGGPSAHLTATSHPEAPHSSEINLLQPQGHVRYCGLLKQHLGLPISCSNLMRIEFLRMRTESGIPVTCSATSTSGRTCKS